MCLGRSKRWTIKSLFYCREEVEAQFAEWTAAQVGSHGDGKRELDGQFSREAVVEHIQKAIAALKSIDESSLREDLDRAVTRLEELLANLGDSRIYREAAGLDEPLRLNLAC